MTAPILVTVEQAAEVLAIGRTRVYQLAADGTLEKRYIGKSRFRLTYESLQRFANSLPTEPEQAAS